MTPRQPSDTNGRVCVAQIGGAHGVRGEVRLKAFTADPMAVARYGLLETEDGTRRLEVAALRPAKNMLVARFKGVGDRDTAEALCNLRLYIPRDRLAEPDEDEFYHADLIGLTAMTPDARAVGTIMAVQNFGAGDLLEIAPAAGGVSMLIPFTKASVPIVDLAAGRVVVVPPPDAAGDG